MKTISILFNNGQEINEEMYADLICNLWIQIYSVEHNKLPCNEHLLSMWTRVCMLPFLALKKKMYFYIWQLVSIFDLVNTMTIRYITQRLQWIRNKNLQFIYKFDVNLCRGDWTTFNEWRDCRMVSDETGSMYIILFVNMTSQIHSKKYVYDVNMFHTQKDI